ncbi:MAG: DEAD/DEAH box helicase [Candidatus Aenigmarchaeota archaeon]|nr:DEAD/DEAH box helicase [Candidatus Aenigmarchaeota archaeon]MDW8160269.1 DEAD/DEAH box helicase [Candidatus Aenigmarchaeota archaeon]
MRVEDLKNFEFEEKWIERLKKLRISNFYPPQEEFIKRRLFEKSCIVSSPTASGKTILAFLSTICCLKNNRKVLYTSPLVSLAFEKYEDFSEFFREYKVAISVSDFDSSDPWLQNYDIIITTNEKLDSLIRHGAEWISEVGLFIVDEIHLLNDLERGATLEVVIVKMKNIVKNLKILGLSATIKNRKELSEWLECELLESDFRPITLYQGVAYDSKIKFHNKADIKLEDGLNLEEAIVNDTLNRKKQILIFCSTRKNTEALAERLSKFVRTKISKNELEILEKISDEVENSLEVPTKQCKKLSSCIKCGVGFHHSGLTGKQRRLVEENFKKGIIKVLTATTSLAYGVNLPAFRVLIKDIKRYHPSFGYVYIPIMEYYQMIGRCGRPKYDEYGEAIVLVKDEDDAEIIFDRFIYGEPEPITSKLANESVLRMHILALIASNFCKSDESLKKFFSSTFFSYKYGDIYLLEDLLEKIIETLKEWGFVVEKNKKYDATLLGKRISQLYLDPLTGKIFVDALKKMEELEEFSVLQLVSFSNEMRPLPSIKTLEILKIVEEVEKNKNVFLIDIPENDEDYENFEKSVKMAKILEDWINEKTEEEILEKYSITPGELYSRIQIADWLLYSLHEIALLMGKKNLLRKINKLRVRIQKGVKEELLQLVSIEGIGRVRARKLYRYGIKNVEDLKKIPLETLSRIIGEKTARSVKNIVENKNKTEEKQKTLI